MSLDHPFFGPLLSWVWQSTALCLLVWLSTRLLRNGSARVRHALWSLVLIRLLIPPVAWWPEACRPEVLPSSWVGLTAPWQSDLAGDGSPSWTATGVRPPGELDSGPIGEPKAPSNARVASAGPDWPARLVLALWAAGCALFLIRTIRQSLTLKRWVAATSPPRRDVVQTFRRLCNRLGIRRRVELLEIESLDSPATVRWWRPTVLLPVKLSQELSPEELESVLVHELLHVRRRDLEIHWLATLARAIHFFHPVAWWTFRSLGRERELAVDECAVRQGGLSMNQYRKTLVRVASLLAAAPRVLPQASLALSEGARDLKHRLVQLRAGRLSPFAWMALAPAVLLLGVSLAAPASSAGTDQELTPAQLDRWVRKQCEAARVRLPQVEKGGLEIAKGSVGGIVLVRADGRLEVKTVQAAADGKSFDLPKLAIEPIEILEDVTEGFEIEELEEPVEVEEIIEEPVVEEVEEIIEEPVVEEVEEVVEEPEVEEVEEIIEEPVEILEEVEEVFELEPVEPKDGLVRVSVERVGSSARYRINGAEATVGFQLPKGYISLRVEAGPGATVTDVAMLLDRANAAGIRTVQFDSGHADTESVKKALEPLSKLSTADYVSSKEIVLLVDRDVPFSTVSGILTVAALELRNPRVTLAATDAKGKLTKLSAYLPVDIQVKKL